MRSVNDVVDYGPYPRSMLLSAVPCGCGTGQLESLHSYVDRLVAAHRTTRYQFDRFVWARAGVPPPRCRQHTRRSYDTPSPASDNFASCLAELTRQPAVARLGLGWLHPCISPNDALRHHIAWCDECLLESSFGTRPLYLPLLWSLNCVKACPIHRRVLSTTCWSCGSLERPWARLAFPFQNCPVCKEPLATAASVRGSCTRASEGQLLAAELVATFIRELQDLRKDDLVLPPRLHDAAASAVQRGRCRSRHDFAKRTGIDMSMFTHAAKGGLSSVNLAVRVAATAGLSLAGLLVPRLWGEIPIRGIGNTDDLDVPLRPYRCALNQAAVRNEIAAQLRSRYPISPGKLARDLGVYPRHLVRAAGEKVDMLSHAYRAGLKRLRDDRARALADRLVVEAGALRSQGLKVSAHKLARRVRLDYTNVVFTLAMRLASPALGARYADYGRNRILKRHLEA
jgi:TniQ